MPDPVDEAHQLHPFEFGSSRELCLEGVGQNPYEHDLGMRGANVLAKLIPKVEPLVNVLVQGLEVLASREILQLRPPGYLQ